MHMMYAADGFVEQTGDPNGTAEGFVDPSTEETRNVPLEIMAEGEKSPFYGETLEVSFQSTTDLTSFFIAYIPRLYSVSGIYNQELGLYTAQTRLPFNAFGTMAMAREVSIIPPLTTFLSPNSVFEKLNVICFGNSTCVVDRSLTTFLVQARYSGY